jgi:hypothetical protein
VAGATISTSTRLGYRWLNGDRSWMYGLNAGYDSRPMNTGGTDTGIIVSGTEKSAFFQQVAVNAEAVSNVWDFNAYALLPVGDTEQQLNWFYQGGALNTYGLDVGYFITPELNAAVGCYYQHGDMGDANGAGVLGSLAYEMTSGVTAGVNVSYDEAFETRVSADLKVRFGGASTTAQRKDVLQLPVINALQSTPSKRDVRIHDGKNCLPGMSALCRSLHQRKCSPKGIHEINEIISISCRDSHFCFLDVGGVEQIMSKKDYVDYAIQNSGLCGSSVRPDIIESGLN